MSSAMDLQLRRRLGSFAATLVRALPGVWRSTARRRRFLFLSLCAPGFAAVVALPLHKNLWVLIAGTLAVLTASALRALSELTLSLGDPQ